MNLLSPQQIVGGLNRRESGAFTWIYTEYYAGIAAMTRRLTHGSADAEDLAHESFMKLLGHSGRFESLEKVRRFLNNSTRNNCLDYMRHREVVSSRLDTVAQHYGSNTTESPAAVETVSWYIGLICQAMEKLPPQSKQVFQLWYWDELSNAEIAKRMDLSEKTVANHKSHALKFLKVEVLKTGLYSLILFLLKLLK